MPKKQISAAKRTAYTGITAALAIALSFLENLIPPISALPPGAKIGFANIAVMFALLNFSYADAVIIVIIKSVFVLITRGAAAFFMSIAGGLLSIVILIAVLAISKKTGRSLSYIFLSVTGAMFHNIGQLIAAGFYMSTFSVAWYLPVMIICALGSGIVTGIVLKIVIPPITNIISRQ